MGSVAELRKTRQEKLAGEAEEIKTPAEDLLVRIKADIGNFRFGKVAEKVNPVDPEIYATLNGLVDVCGNPKALKRFKKYPPVEQLTRHPKFRSIIENEAINRAVANMDFKSLLDSEPIAELLKDKELIAKIKKIDWKEAVAFAKEKE